MGPYIRKTACPYGCPTPCGLLAETDGIRLLGVKGDSDHSATKGLICRKMRHYKKPVHSPERILIPMKRVGVRGKGRFEPVTWDDAVKEIAGRWNCILEEDGADAILPMYYSGVISIPQCKCGNAFLNRMRACDMARTFCSSAKGVGYEAVMGQTDCLDPRELKGSSLYLVWGSNMKATRLQSTSALTQARRQGERVVFIESCAADIEVYCNQIILIRPGTDGALALVMMHAMEEENLADRDLLAHRTNEYEAFRKTLAPHIPAWTEGETGIPAEVIVGLSGEYALVPAPVIISGSGPSRYGNGRIIIRLVTILSAYTGAWGRSGGGLYDCNPGAGSYVNDQLVTRPDSREKPGRRVNTNETASTLIGSRGEKPIRSFYVYGGNPAVSVCCQKGILEGLLRPDLFMAVHERFMTDTVMYAGILLPAIFPVEQTDVYAAYGYCTSGMARKIAEPAGQSKSNWNTFRLLVWAMGYGGERLKRTEKEMVWELLVHPMEGLIRIPEKEWRILREGGVISMAFANHGNFRMPSGKMVIYNENLEEATLRHMESYRGAYPLRLVAVPSAYTLNSVFMDREDLSSGRGPMTLMLHSRDTVARKIADGSRVTTFNELVKVESTAKITPAVAEGTVVARGVYNRILTKDGFLANAFCHERLSDIGATTTLNDNTVDARSCQGRRDSRKRDRI